MTTNTSAASCETRNKQMAPHGDKGVELISLVAVLDARGG